VNSPPAYVRLRGLYYPATTIARPRANLPPADGARAKSCSSIRFRPLTYSAHSPQRPTAGAPGTSPFERTSPSHGGCTGRSTSRGLIHHPLTDSHHGPIADAPSLNPAGRDAIAEPRPRPTSKRNAISAGDGNHLLGVHINVHGADRPPHRRNPELRANSPSTKNCAQIQERKL
jgi:hypothetical protein